MWMSLTCISSWVFCVEINEVNGCRWRRINWIRCMWFWSGSSRRATSNTSSPHCNTWISPFTIHYAQTQRKNRPYNRSFDSIIKKKTALLSHCCNTSVSFPSSPDVSHFRLHGVFTSVNICDHKNSFLIWSLWCRIMQCLIMNFALPQCDCPDWSLLIPSAWISILICHSARVLIITPVFGLILLPHCDFWSLFPWLDEVGNM